MKLEKDTNKKIQKDEENNTIEKRMISEDIGAVQPITLSRREFQYDDDDEIKSHHQFLNWVLPMPSISVPRKATS